MRSAQREMTEMIKQDRSNAELEASGKSDNLK